MENKLREDLWKSIQAHYERNDYTEAVRDAIFHTSELLREKSGFYDKDGSKLVEASLLGNTPVILVNKNETTTERDIQQGIGFAFKGIMQSVRNLISHEKFVYTQNEAEAIILYINYLLNQVDHSGGVTKIDNIMELLYDEDFTCSEEYAELLLKEVPVKKRYDLLLKLFSNREQLPQNKLKYFINQLYNALSKTTKTDFCKVVSKNLMKCKDDRNLRMYIHYFMDITYSEIDKLAQLRIEDLVYRSIKNGELEYYSDDDFSPAELRCNTKGTLGTWLNAKIELLSNKDKIISAISEKMFSSINEQRYVFEYFSCYFKEPSSFTDREIKKIKQQLTDGNALFQGWLEAPIDVFENKEYVDLFGEEYAKCKEINAQLEAYPF